MTGAKDNVRRIMNTPSEPFYVDLSRNPKGQEKAFANWKKIFGICGL